LQYILEQRRTCGKKYDEHSLADLGREWTASNILSPIKTKRHIERGCFSPSGERLKDITGKSI
jgi:hypothetical protein